MTIIYICEDCGMKFENKNKCKIHEKTCTNCWNCKNKINSDYGWGKSCKLCNTFENSKHKCKDYIKLPANNADKITVAKPQGENNE